MMQAGRRQRNTVVLAVADPVLDRLLARGLARRQRRVACTPLTPPRPLWRWPLDGMARRGAAEPARKQAA